MNNIEILTNKLTAFVKSKKLDKKFSSSNFILRKYNKSHSFYYHFLYKDFNSDNFIQFILNNFKLNTTYSIIIKVSSQNNSIFKMCGSQIGIVIKENYDLNYLKSLHEVIQFKIELIIDNYDYMDQIDIIEINYSIINLTEELKLTNINNLEFPNNIINVKKVKKYFNHNFLPLTIDERYFGDYIYNYTEQGENFKKLILNAEILNKNFKITPDDRIYLYKPSKAYKNLTNLIILSQTDTQNDKIFLRHIYNITGIKLLSVIDTLDNNHNDLSKITFSRKIDNTTLLIKNQIVQQTALNIPLNKIINYKKTGDISRNINFGVFDLETYIDLDGLAKVYALGFLTYNETQSTLFYLDDIIKINTEKENKADPLNLNLSDKLILLCINSMLKPKYNKFIFFSHNLGRYDVVFIYRTLIKYNQIKGFEYYKLNTILRDNVIIKLEIKINKNRVNDPSENNKENFNKNYYIKITFIDSLNLLNNSLDTLAKDFKITHKKGHFPYNFVTFNNLNYIGNTPDKFYYNDISDKEYLLLIKNDWNLKLECLKYLNNDLNCLLTIMNEFSKIINIYYKAEITEAMTITRLSFNIFFNNYYKPKNNDNTIPLINKLFIYNFIKEGYYGGITEVYKPYGRNLVYIDVNSLYPFAALSDLPGTQCDYLESFSNEGLNLDNLFGFFYAKVKTNNQYLGLLPIHDNNNNLINPEGEYEGIWSSVELNFAKEKGYDIFVKNGYNFNILKCNPFKDFITDLYNKKKNSTGSVRIITKSLLNNLLGRFGLSLIKPISRIVNYQEKDYITSTREIYSLKVINYNNFLISYNPSISKKICNEHGLDFIKVLKKEKNLNIEKNLDIFKDISIATIAMITAHARIFMLKLKLEILKNKGNIYYSDTDSLVIDKEILDNRWLGSNIGQFKLEYSNIKEAYFISSKTYCLVLENNETIIKAKGVINKNLTKEDFINMYKNNLNINTVKNHTTTNLEYGSVLIEKKNIILNFDSYTKRQKIYDDNGIWIDTKPLNLNNQKNNK